jgi:hypothetical protein
MYYVKNIHNGNFISAKTLEIGWHENAVPLTLLELIHALQLADCVYPSLHLEITTDPALLAREVAHSNIRHFNTIRHWPDGSYSSTHKGRRVHYFCPVCDRPVSSPCGATPDDGCHGSRGRNAQGATYPLPKGKHDA